jgi:hypothetical protein
MLPEFDAASSAHLMRKPVLSAQLYRHFTPPVRRKPDHLPTKGRHIPFIFPGGGLTFPQKYARFQMIKAVTKTCVSGKIPREEPLSAARAL